MRSKNLGKCSYTKRSIWCLLRSCRSFLRHQTDVNRFQLSKLYFAFKKRRDINAYFIMALILYFIGIHVCSKLRVTLLNSPCHIMVININLYLYFYMYSSELNSRAFLIIASMFKISLTHICREYSYQHHFSYVFVLFFIGN